MATQATSQEHGQSLVIIIIQFICIAPESIVLLSGALHKCTNTCSSSNWMINYY